MQCAFRRVHFDGVYTVYWVTYNSDYKCHVKINHVGESHLLGFYGGVDFSTSNTSGNNMSP